MGNIEEGIRKTIEEVEKTYNNFPTKPITITEFSVRIVEELFSKILTFIE